MNKYELVVIVDAALPQEEKEKVIAEVGETIAKYEGQVTNTQVWLDKHKFSFRMKKRPEGTYYLVNFQSPSNALTGIRQDLKIEERVLRSLIIKL